MFLAQLLLTILPITHALPNFSCICESSNLNGCSSAYSCRLNKTVDFFKTPVPDWVTDSEETLFINTIDDAVAGLLTPPFFTLGRMTWEAAIACDDDEGELTWYHQLSQCRGGRIPGTNETRRRYHGWANLGFHPLGNQPGTWLTQIIGEIAGPDGEDDGHLVHAMCADTGLYVSVDYINATQPYDPRFSPQGEWGMLYLYGSGHVYPVGGLGVPSYRTDGDLVDNGVELNCTGHDKSGRVCVEPRCFEPANVTHYDCPVGRKYGVGGLNCSRRYAAVDENGAVMGRGAEAVGAVSVAGLVALGLSLVM